ncbi:MAG: CapA family protein [Caldilineaceae bacterium]
MSKRYPWFIHPLRKNVRWLVLCGVLLTLLAISSIDAPLLKAVANASPNLSSSPIRVALAPDLPKSYAKAFLTVLKRTPSLPTTDGAQPLTLVDRLEAADVQVKLSGVPAKGAPLAERFYAVVVPFATVHDDIAFAEVKKRWQSGDAQSLIATEEAAAMLPVLLGARTVTPVTNDQLLTKLEAAPGAVGLIAFDQLDPRYKVLTVDGVNLLDNHLQPALYPLAMALTVEGKEASLLAPLLQPLTKPYTNRAANQLTTLIMTGVTAMSRGTAAQMDQRGAVYPAAKISDTLAAADITHVSNEVPFLADCVTRNIDGNLTLCSKPAYWAALEAIGTDIVGLSGNHLNDFGYEGARESLTWYRDHKIPIYGSGLNLDEACAPLFWKHNGNTFAFLAYIAWGPSSDWATAKLPGTCYYYDHKQEYLATVRDLAKKVNIVAVELQYEETYNPYPTGKQVTEFRELREAGAKIVSGVQSHVPQAMETYGAQDKGGPGAIGYGLGNLFFDQMWSWDTRTELYERYTIYQGRVLSSEILTGVLENYAQPRWATPQERATLLQSIFDAAPKRP